MVNIINHHEDTSGKPARTGKSLYAMLILEKNKTLPSCPLKQEGAQFIREYFTHNSIDPLKFIESFGKKGKNNQIFLSQMKKIENDQKNDQQDIKENVKRKVYTDSLLRAYIIFITQIKKENIFIEKDMKHIINNIELLAKETNFYDFNNKQGNPIIISAFEKLKKGTLGDDEVKTLAENIQRGISNDNQPLSEIFKIEQITLEKAGKLLDAVKNRTTSINSNLSNRRLENQFLNKSGTLYFSAKSQQKETIPQEIFIGFLLDHITHYLTFYKKNRKKGVSLNNNGDIVNATDKLTNQLQEYTTKQDFQNQITAIAELAQSIGEENNQ